MSEETQICSACGYKFPASKRSNVCPECGVVRERKKKCLPETK